MKRTVPLFITGIVGTLLIISYYVPHPPFDEVERLIPDFFNIIAAFAFILGGGNLLRIHLTRVSRRDHEWMYSAVTVVGFLGMLILGLLKVTGAEGSAAGIQANLDLADPRLLYDWLYRAIFVPCQSTMFSLLAFFVASASYRAFRAKTPEATVLLLAAFIILVGRTPFGHLLTAWMPEPFSDYFHIPNLSAWVMSYPNTAGQRTIQIGIALGIISNSLRLILGVERSHLGGGGTEMVEFFRKLGALDRRWIFLFIAVSVTIPLLMERPAPVPPSPIVRTLFDAVEALPPGSRVLLSLDYGPSTAPENDPMAQAVARHCLSRDLKLYLMTIWATGPPLITNLLEQVVALDFPEKVYGEDFVNLGYKVGNQGLIQALTSDFKGQYTADAGWGDAHPSLPTTQIPMMEPIRTVRDVALIIGIGSGKPGLKEWVQFAGDPAGVPVGGGVTAVEAPLLYPYYNAGQLEGLMGGLLGAAEYEALLTESYPQFAIQAQTALIRMFPQTVAHLVIVVFVLIGNVSFFVLRRAERKR